MKHLTVFFDLCFGYRCSGGSVNDEDTRIYELSDEAAKLFAAEKMKHPDADDYTLAQSVADEGNEEWKQLVEKIYGDKCWKENAYWERQGRYDSDVMDRARENAPKYGWQEPEDYDCYCSRNGYDVQEDGNVPEEWPTVAEQLLQLRKKYFATYDKAAEEQYFAILNERIAARQYVDLMTYNAWMSQQFEDWYLKQDLSDRCWMQELDTSCNDADCDYTFEIGE